MKNLCSCTHKVISHKYVLEQGNTGPCLVPNCDCKEMEKK